MASDNECNSDQENIANKLCIKEESTYPLNNKILYKECVNNITKRSFNYGIVKEGVYLDDSKFPNSECNSDQENIANKLCIKEESTYPLNNKILYKECVNNITKRSFNYGIVKEGVYLDDSKFPIQIKYGPDFQQVVSSNISPSTIASIYEKTLNPNTKTTISGPLLFGLQLSSVQKERDAKRRGHLIKPALNLKAVDHGQISRDSYRDLAATDYHMARAYSVFDKRVEITNYINQKIKFSIVDMKGKDNLENIEFGEPDITNSDIIKEVTNTIGVGVLRSAKDILCYIIPHLLKEQVLDPSDPTIHLRVSGDGRNVGRKIKHVMVTFMILNHESKSHDADYHYTVALYPGTENYNTLKFILNPFLEELRSFKDDGLELNGILWKFELYFSSDWKFLAICLGLNSANSKYFCPWCMCSKNQLGDLNKDWNIEKNMDEISRNYININVVSSNISPSTVASIYEKTLNPNTKTTISGPLLFGLQLSSVQKERDAKRRGHLIKPALNCVSSTLEKRAKKIGTIIQSNFKNDINKIYHPSDKVTLKTVEFSVNQMEYQVNFECKNQLDENYIQSIVKAVDHGQISRDSYRDLAATDYHMARAYSVFDKRVEITNYINQKIKFSIVDMKGKDNLENIEFGEPDITNSDIIKEVTNTIGVGVLRSAKDILCYIIPHLLKEQVLDPSDPTIHLRVSDDGRNVGRKIKHVMVTFMILNHESNRHDADYHYTIALYPGTENYNTLKFILNPFLEELHSFKDDGLELNGILWKFELYFSSDWKFLAICLGLNSANSKYFCPWCMCSKNQLGDLNKDWNIEKNMDEISRNYININSHINPPLFSMIPMDNIIFDELHVFLRITDRLWELVIAEIKEKNLFNDLTRKVIVDEMH
ncbi:hypothetical protein Glove_184g131 [Diversispora epigaea]|uniref:Uncharacterized protein n=1 Tax=Diversispora epigaea TaxID=1348612 RepID=A0A397IS98_9GLOM|nr:hypothetical protein Glove_184g131 [Diversispora epigaea]